MKRWALVVLMLAASCGRREPQPGVSVPRYPVSGLKGATALREVGEFIQLGDRTAGTEAGRRAAVYLVKRLTALGVSAEIDEFQDSTPSGPARFRNVTAVIRGTEPGMIVLGAHYDTKSGIPSFIGANDSGSGVGLLLALAPILKAGAVNGPSVWLAFLDGEECQVTYGPNDGLHGSRHLAATLAATGRAREVRAFILFDMIGDRDLSVTIPRNGTPALVSAVFKAASEEGVRSLFSLANQSILDDHQAFIDAGIPAIDLIDFEYGSEPRLNDYWHTAADTIDKLSAGSLESVGRVVLRVLNAAAHSPSGSFRTDS